MIDSCIEIYKRSMIFLPRSHISMAKEKTAKEDIYMPLKKARAVISMSSCIGSIAELNGMTKEELLESLQKETLSQRIEDKNENEVSEIKNKLPAILEIVEKYGVLTGFTRYELWSAMIDNEKEKKKRNIPGKIEKI